MEHVSPEGKYSPMSASDASLTVQNEAEEDVWKLCEHTSGLV